MTSGRVDELTQQAAGRVNDPGYIGFNDKRQQQCMTCWGWKFPAIHSCPGVPQAGRTPPPRHLRAVSGDQS